MYHAALSLRPKHWPKKQLCFCLTATNKLAKVHTLHLLLSLHSISTGMQSMLLRAMEGAAASGTATLPALGLVQLCIMSLAQAQLITGFRQSPPAGLRS